MRKLTAIVSMLSVALGMSACEPTQAQVKEFIGDVKSGIEFVVDQVQGLGDRLDVTYNFDTDREYGHEKIFRGTIHADLDNDGKTEQYDVIDGRVIREVSYVGPDGKRRVIDSDSSDFNHLVDKSGNICFEGVYDVYGGGEMGVPFRIDTDSPFLKHKYFSLDTSDGKRLRFVDGKQVFAKSGNHILNIGYWSLDGKFDEKDPYKHHTLLAVVGDEKPEAETPYAGTKEKIVTEDGKDVFGGWHDKVLEIFYYSPDDIEKNRNYKSWKRVSYALVVEDRKLAYYDKDGNAVTDEKFIQELDKWNNTALKLNDQVFESLHLNDLDQ